MVYRRSRASGLVERKKSITCWSPSRPMLGSIHEMRSGQQVTIPTGPAMSVNMPQR
jgi:hypothetical protein